MPKVQAGLLLQECGFIDLSAASADNEAAASGDEAHQWTVPLGDEGIRAYCDAHRHRLVLEADVTTASALRSAATEQLLLHYNHHASSTGARMAIDPEDGCIVLIADLVIASLNADTLRNAVLALHDLRRSWNEAAAQSGSGGEHSAAAPAETTILHG
jgi:hypothetical protein